MERILVTGGAGFIGSVLCPPLNDRYSVRVLDNLMYGGLGLLPNFTNPRFEFVKGSILDRDLVLNCLRDVDTVIHLAAIVGYPACKKNPELSYSVNCGAVKLLVQLLRKNQRLVFPSTASCYGDMPSGICHEETVLNPVSAYGREKAEAERIVAQHGNTVVLRLATAFGLSPRLRLDLLINDFVYQALKNKHLIVYEKDFRRSFVHVRDIARAFLFCLDNFEKMCGQTFNVGSSHLNLTKEEIALGIRKRLDFILHFADAGHDEDLRNYYLSFDKIERLGFRCVVDLDTGINELIRGLDVVEVKNPFSNI